MPYPPRWASLFRNSSARSSNTAVRSQNRILTLVHTPRTQWSLIAMRMRLCERQYNAGFVGYSPENECGRVLGLAAALTFRSFLIEQYQPYQHESQDAPFLGRFVFHQTTSRRSHRLARSSARTNGPSALNSWFGRGLLRSSAKRPPKSARGGSKTIVLSRTDSTASWKTHWRTRPGLGRDNAMPLKSCRYSAENLPGQTAECRSDRLSLLRRNSGTTSTIAPR